MKTIAVLIVFCILTGCSREQLVSIGNSVGKSYNESNRDHIIEGLQAKVASTPACAEFKGRFKTAADHYGDAANGAFMQDMQKVWDATKAAGCASPV